MIKMRYLHRAVLSLALIPLTSLSFVAVNLQVSTRSKTVQVGSTAQAQRRTSELFDKLIDIAAETVFTAGLDWTADRISERFSRSQNTLEPAVTNVAATTTYVGSSFIGSVPYQGRFIVAEYIALSTGQWYGRLNVPGSQWSAVGVPSIAVYRTADFFSNASGQVFYRPVYY